MCIFYPAIHQNIQLMCINTPSSIYTLSLCYPLLSLLFHIGLPLTDPAQIDARGAGGARSVGCFFQHLPGPGGAFPGGYLTWRRIPTAPGCRPATHKVCFPLLGDRKIPSSNSGLTAADGMRYCGLDRRTAGTDREIGPGRRCVLQQWS